MFTFSSTIRLRSKEEHKAKWHFLNVPKDISEQISVLASQKPRKGFGSVKVEAQIWFMKRRTSIFPDKKSGTYMLAIKKEVRKELNIWVDSEVMVLLTPLD